MKRSDIIKTIMTVILTILAHWYAILERGFTGIGGGETLVPLLCILLLWVMPALTTELIEELKRS